MNEHLKKNSLNYSTDDIQRRKNKDLSPKHEMHDSKTLPYLNTTNNNKNLHNKNSFFEEKKIQILEYSTKYKTVEPDDDLVNIGDDDSFYQKKKLEKKVNRNLKLLNLIKGRMNQEKNKINENNEIEEINVGENIKENINKEMGQKKKEKISDEKLEDKKEKKIIDEEKKNKLLNIINSKKYNKFQRKEGNDEEKESVEKDNNNKDSNNTNNVVNTKLKKILSQSKSLTPYTTLYKQETYLELDYYSIKTSRENEKDKLDDNIEEQILHDNKINLENKDKLNDFQKQKNKISLNKRAKTNSVMSDFIKNQEKTVSKNQNNNPSSNSKKGALKIVELLKMKKKEENENSRAKTQEKQIKNEEKNEKAKFKNISKKIYSKNRRNLEIDSFPLKNRNEEDDNENKAHNRTQPYFRDLKKIVDNNKVNLNTTDINNKKKKYFNINKNRVIKQAPNNNNIYNDFLDNSKNLQKFERVNYHNPIGIKNKLRKRLNNFMTDISNSMKKNKNNRNIEIVNLNNKSNIRTLDNNLDVMKQNQNKLSKTMINNNNSIYKPKRISCKNSPQRSYERNEENIMYNKNNSNMHSNIPKRSPNAYIKKSPGKIQDNYGSRALYNKKTKKLKNSVIDRHNFNNSYNNLAGNHNNILGVDFNSSMDTYNTNKYDSTSTNIITKDNIKNMKLQKQQNNTSVIFNLEDLLILEERLNDIGMALENYENFENKCFNFWNYFYNCSLPYLLEKIFKSKEDSNMVRLSINYELMSIMVCYEYSFDIDFSSQDIYLLLLELIDLNHNNLIIISEYILTKIVPENKQNIWVLQLQNIIKNSKIIGNNKYYKNAYFQNLVEKINFNTNLIIKKLKNILLNYPTELSDILITLLKNIDTKTYEEIDDFYKEYILRIDNFEGSIIASSYLKKNKNFKSLPAPYLPFPPTKPYTLVLDLDETLVYFKIKSSKGGTLRARPYLFGFLEEMGHYYE